MAATMPVVHLTEAFINISTQQRVYWHEHLKAAFGLLLEVLTRDYPGLNDKKKKGSMKEEV